MFEFQLLKGNEWLQFFDVMQQQVQHTQNYATMGYLPYTFVSFHLLFAASGPKPTLSWPNVQFEMKSKLQKSQNLLKSMIADMLPAARIFASPQTLVCYRTLNVNKIDNIIAVNSKSDFNRQ